MMTMMAMVMVMVLGVVMMTTQQNSDNCVSTYGLSPCVWKRSIPDIKRKTGNS